MVRLRSATLPAVVGAMVSQACVDATERAVIDKAMAELEPDVLSTVRAPQETP